MKKKILILAMTVVAFVGWQQRSQAVIGTIDAVPAATLLVPYFQVDLSNPQGLSTLFSINNSDSAAVLANVTVWTDLGVRTMRFNVYLTGYDVQTINVRDLFFGPLPATGSAGQDPSDTISPKGTLSSDINFAGCAGFLPPPAPSAAFFTDLRSAHTGASSATLGNKCAGRALGDTIARGYITVDVVSNCTADMPGSAGYFVTNGTGVAKNTNVLWGDYFYVDPANNFAQGDTLVHIEADGADPQTSVAGQYTFYGAYTPVAWSAADNREPLATNFAIRFLNGGAFDGGTNMIAWRDIKTVQAAFTCGTPPAWYPLNVDQMVIFDEQENPFVPPVFPFFPPPPASVNAPFPGAASSTRAGGPTFPLPYTFGWIFFNLNTTIAGNANPPEDPAATQAWLTITHDALGRYSVGYSALQMDSAKAANHNVIPAF